MATGAIIPDGLLVQVFVATFAIRFGFTKTQRLVAGSAVQRLVGAGQRKISFGVCKTEGIFWKRCAGNFGNFGCIGIKIRPVVGTDFPSRRSMTGGTIDFKVGAMRILR